MNPATPRTRAVRLLTGGAAGALALGALALVPAPATAAPDQTRAAIGAPAASSAVQEVAARAATRTTRVSTSRQLRKAVSQANRRAGTDRIVLDSNVRLTEGGGRGDGPLRGDVDVTDDLIVVGANNNINARRVDRIFDVTSGVRLELRNVTLRNGAPAAGESGGAVRGTGATVIAVGVTAVDNTVDGEGASGGAFMNDDGVLRIRRSDLLRNVAVRAGGAIEANAGATSVSDSDLSSNSAGASPGNGGAIHLTGDGTVDVERTVAKFNVAAAEGGAFWNSDMGIFNLSESILSSNVAAGVAADNGGGALYNDGGILNVTTSQLNNNFATGTAGSGGAILNNNGRLTVENTKMISNSANRAGGAIEAVSGSTDVIDSVMRANEAGSAPGNGGALHLSETGDVLVSGGRVVDNTAALEGGGLWNSSTGTMEVAQVTFRGNTAAGELADNGGGALYNDGGTLLVRGSELDDNSATGAAGSGGGILNNAGGLTVVNTTIDGGSAPRAGGAIEAVAGTTTITRSSMEENSAGPNPGNGGAVHLTGAGSVVVTSSSFGANSAVEGGALWNSATGTMTIDRSEIIGNTASGAAADQGGGGVYTDGGDLTITDSIIRDNIADGASGSGGGVFNNAAELTIGSSTLRGNTAVRAGGGIETNAGTVTLTDVDLDSNVTGANPGNGGGFHAGGVNTVLYIGGTVSGNTAANEGGGLWCGNAGTFTATGITFNANAAPDGDDVYHQDAGATPTVSLCSVNGTVIAQGTGTP